MSDKQQTQFEETLAVITIAALLLGAGAYVVAVRNVPVLSPILYWIALQAYRFVPALAHYDFPHAPHVVSAIIVGAIFFCASLPFTRLLANAFSPDGTSNMEKQTARLRKNRARLKKRRRDNDNFIVN